MKHLWNKGDRSPIFVGHGGHREPTSPDLVKRLQFMSRILLDGSQHFFFRTEIAIPNVSFLLPARRSSIRVRVFLWLKSLIGHSFALPLRHILPQRSKGRWLEGLVNSTAFLQPIDCPPVICRWNASWHQMDRMSKKVPTNNHAQPWREGAVHMARGSPSSAHSIS